MSAKLPKNRVCKDCRHFLRCRDVLGCTWADRQECDWDPSRFVKSWAEKERDGSEEG